MLLNDYGFLYVATYWQGKRHFALVCNNEARRLEIFEVILKTGMAAQTKEHRRRVFYRKTTRT